VQIEQIAQALSEHGQQRVSAIVYLARETGMRLREVILADLPRLQREARQLGKINIQDGTKGGRSGASAPRWIAVTDQVRDALYRASEASPNGSRNLLTPDESYKVFLRAVVRPARDILHEHGLKGFHELRAAYACERYEQLTGFSAPVNGGRGHREDRVLDRQARQQISHELGHNRIDVVSAYIGGRR
jgi:integrase